MHPRTGKKREVETKHGRGSLPDRVRPFARLSSASSLGTGDTAGAPSHATLFPDRRPPRSLKSRSASFPLAVYLRRRRGDFVRRLSLKKILNRV